MAYIRSRLKHASSNRGLLSGAFIHQSCFSCAAHDFARLENARIPVFCGHARENVSVCPKVERRVRQDARVGQRLYGVSRRDGYGEKREKAGNERKSARDRVRTVHGKEKAMRAHERRNGAAARNTRRSCTASFAISTAVAPPAHERVLKQFLPAGRLSHPT